MRFYDGSGEIKFGAISAIKDLSSLYGRYIPRLGKAVVKSHGAAKAGFYAPKGKRFETFSKGMRRATQSTKGMGRAHLKYVVDHPIAATGLVGAAYVGPKMNKAEKERAKRRRFKEMALLQPGKAAVSGAKIRLSSAYSPNID